MWAFFLGHSVHVYRAAYWETEKKQLNKWKASHGASGRGVQSHSAPAVQWQATAGYKVPVVTVTSKGRESSGQQTTWATDDWATCFGQLSDMRRVNWTTHVWAMIPLSRRDCWCIRTIGLCGKNWMCSFKQLVKDKAKSPWMNSSFSLIFQAWHVNTALFLRLHTAGLLRLQNVSLKSAYYLTPVDRNEVRMVHGCS